MATVYLVRHGAPAFPQGQRCCLGHTDISLSPEGVIHGKNLGLYFKNQNLPVYCSSLRRSIETAYQIAPSGNLCAMASFSELHAGAWDGLSFEQIRREYPDYYQKRGEDPALPPLGGEEIAIGVSRFLSGLSTIKGDCIIVGHSSLNRGIIAHAMHLNPNKQRDIPQPYGCINRFDWQDQVLSPCEIGVMPQLAPDEVECHRLWQKYKTPLPVIQHSKMVAKKALEIETALTKQGCGLNRRLLLSAALLHDLLRASPNHACVGAEKLRQEGYPQVAEVVKKHHNLQLSDLQEPNEALVLFVADKLTQEDRFVTLEQRFASSKVRCTTPFALEKWHTQYQQASQAIRLLCNYGAIIDS